MFRVTGGVAVATPRQEPVQHDRPKDADAVATKPADDARHVPRLPQVSEDDMSTCG